MADSGSLPSKSSARVLSGVVFVTLVAGSGLAWQYVRLQGVERDAALLNQFYVPVLRHLNLVGGKWTAYQRSFEQWVGFRNWGGKRNAAEANPQRLLLGKLLGQNLADLKRRIESSRGLPREERATLENWILRISALADTEREELAALGAAIGLKRFDEAAAIYGRVRQEHIAISHELTWISRRTENRLSELQLSLEKHLHDSQLLLLAVLALSLSLGFLVFMRLRRWMSPIVEWTQVAREISLHGTHQGIRFPQVHGGMPPEISLLTREFNRMGTTVLEREKTIQLQKQKLESLNAHLHEKNELAERILSSMTSGLLLVGEAGDVLEVNERYCELFGGTRVQLRGRSVDELLSAWPEPTRSRITGPCVEPFHAPRVELGGKIYSARVQPLVHQGGRLILFEDITELVQIAERLEHVQKLVLAGNFSSQVAHEVRNPLNSICLNLDMILDDVTDEGVLRKLRAIEEQVQRLERITERYLDVGPSGKGQAKTSLRIDELIEKALAFLSPEIQAARIQVCSDLRAGDLLVWANPDAVSQVLFNLFRNSIEALSSPTVENRVISVRSAGGPDNTVEVIVEDTGPGIPAEQRERLFEPFVTSKATGHGLGLSLSRQICIQHGGELKLLPSQQGARFQMKIPRANAVQPIQGAEHVSSPRR